MIKDKDIPVLTDLIEDKFIITQPQLGLNVDQDLLIDTDDDPFIDFDTLQQKPAQAQKSASPVANNLKLEQTIKRIFDEHMALAWQEIRLAIQLSRKDED
jgi:hypothetical protein